MERALFHERGPVEPPCGRNATIIRTTNEPVTRILGKRTASRSGRYQQVACKASETENNHDAYDDNPADERFSPTQRASSNGQSPRHLAPNSAAPLPDRRFRDLGGPSHDAI